MTSRYVYLSVSNEWRGRCWPKPGSITADGRIVGVYDKHEGRGVRLIESGTVFIERRRLAAAERFGWELKESAAILSPNLVAVHRAAPTPVFLRG